MFLDLLKVAGILSVPVTLYFAFTKLGHKVSASFTWTFSNFTAPGIGEVTLINMKDRPLAIFGIYAVMDDLLINLKELNPPLILRAMEAVTVDIEPVSERRLGKDVFEWEPRFGKDDPIRIYLSTSTKTLKCRPQGPPSHTAFAMKRRLKLVSNHTSRFNGVIYNKRARYTLVYNEDGKENTCLIDDNGFISWGLAQNMLSSNDLKSVETVKAALISCGVARIISPFVIQDLREPEGRSPGEALT